AAGRTRALGVSNFMPDHLESLLEQVDVVPAVNQIEVHPYFSQPELRSLMAGNGIATQAWSPIGGVYAYGPKSTTVLEDPVVVDLAGRPQDARAGRPALARRARVLCDPEVGEAAPDRGEHRRLRLPAQPRRGRRRRRARPYPRRNARGPRSSLHGSARGEHASPRARQAQGVDRVLLACGRELLLRREAESQGREHRGAREDDREARRRRRASDSRREPLPVRLRGDGPAQRPQNADARPRIANPLRSIDAYDVVLLGSPIWNVRPPMIMSTFAERFDFSGKTIHPFVT